MKAQPRMCWAMRGVLTSLAFIDLQALARLDATIFHLKEEGVCERYKINPKDMTVCRDCGHYRAAHDRAAASVPPPVSAEGASGVSGDEAMDGFGSDAGGSDDDLFC